MEAYHRVVLCEAEFCGDINDRDTIDNHATKDLCVLGLQFVRLHDHTPTVDCVVLDGGEFQLVDWKHRLLFPAQFVE